jgi:hypothetical protein
MGITVGSVSVVVAAILGRWWFFPHPVGVLWFLCPLSFINGRVIRIHALLRRAGVFGGILAAVDGAGKPGWGPPFLGGGYLERLGVWRLRYFLGGGLRPGEFKRVGGFGDPLAGGSDVLGILW